MKLYLYMSKGGNKPSKCPIYINYERWKGTHIYIGVPLSRANIEKCNAPGNNRYLNVGSNYLHLETQLH